jgi:hypothetical protein
MLDKFIDYRTLFLTIVVVIGYRYLTMPEETVILKQKKI